MKADVLEESKELRLELKGLGRPSIPIIPQNPQGANQNQIKRMDRFSFLEEPRMSEKKSKKWFAPSSPHRTRKFDMHAKEGLLIIKAETHHSPNEYTLLESYVESGVSEYKTPFKAPTSPDVEDTTLLEDTSKKIIGLKKDDILLYCQEEFKNRTSWGKKVAFHNLISFQKTGIKYSLLGFNRGVEAKALKIFIYIMKYMKDTPSRLEKSKLIEYFRKIIQIIFHEADRKLRDELFCQLFKQLNLNETISLKRGWKLLAIVSGFILPNKKLCDCLLSFIKDNYKNTENERIRIYITYAYNRLYHTLINREREYLPEEYELIYLKKCKCFAVLVCLPNGVPAHFSVETYTTFYDIKKAILLKFKLDLAQINYYNIYEVLTSSLNTVERLLSDHDKVFDTLKQWQIESTSLPETYLNVEYKFELKLTFYTPLNEKLINTATFHYIQIFTDYIKHRFPITEKDAIIISSLQAQLINGDYYNSSVSGHLIADLQKYIPSDYLLDNSTNSYYHGRILKLWKRLRKYKKLDCKLAIIDYTTKHSPLSQAKLFVGEKIGEGDNGVIENFDDSKEEEDIEEKGGKVDIPIDIVIVIKNNCLLLCDDELKKILRVISYKYLVNWASNENEIMFLVTKNMKEYKFTYYCKQALYIDFLLNGYIKIFADKNLNTISDQKRNPLKLMEYSQKIKYPQIKKIKQQYTQVFTNPKEKLA